MLAVLALPGVVIHELGHYFFCRLFGAPVREVVFFDRRRAAGYVVHTVPAHLAEHTAIVLGPLVLNTAMAFLLFRAVVTGINVIFLDLPWLDQWLVAQVVLAAWLAASIALQAIPSYADAASLWQVSLQRLGRGYLLAVFALPVAAILVLANHLRRFWFDWLFAAALAGAAVWLPLK